MTVWILRLVGTLCVLVTLLPFLPTGFWFVRGWDFPRFQLAILLAMLVLTTIVFRHKFDAKFELSIWLTLLSVAGLWQAAHVVPFTPLWQKEVARGAADRNAPRLLVVNLRYENGAYERVGSEIAAIDPEVLILIEVDDAWRTGLSATRQAYEFKHEEIRDKGLGMCVWSNLPLRNTRTRFLVEARRPSIWAEVVFDNEAVNLVAVHPTPPGLQDETGEDRRDSRVRDAELVLVAKEIAASKSEAWIVAGDFNDVAWSHTTRLFKRLSGMRDPRIGRRLMGTFHADYPFLRFPIDHVFVSDGFVVPELARHAISGSNHFGVSALLALRSESAGVTPEPEGNDRSEAADIAEQGKQDAANRNALSRGLAPGQ